MNLYEVDNFTPVGMIKYKKRIEEILKQPLAKIQPNMTFNALVKRAHKESLGRFVFVCAAAYFGICARAIEMFTL